VSLDVTLGDVLVWIVWSRLYRRSGGLTLWTFLFGVILGVFLFAAAGIVV
jgi:hypothetical protein